MNSVNYRAPERSQEEEPPFKKQKIMHVSSNNSAYAENVDISPSNLIEAIQKNNLSKVRLLLERGANPNPPLYNSLIEAGRLNHISVMEELLKHGADVTGRIMFIFLSFFVTFDQKVDRMYDLLEKYGGNFNIQDGSKRTPLHYVWEKKEHCLDHLNYMLQRGANTDIQDFNGNTATFTWACLMKRVLNYSVSFTAENVVDWNLTCFKAIEKLCDYDANLNILNNNGSDIRKILLENDQKDYWEYIAQYANQVKNNKKIIIISTFDERFGAGKWEIGISTIIADYFSPNYQLL